MNAYYYSVTCIHIDGQKIAKRLSSSITKETKKAKDLLEEYNATCLQLNITREQSPLELHEVLPINSEFWQASPLSECSTLRGVSWNTKREVIQAFLLKKRCEEELQLLEEAMQNVLKYWSNRIATISGEIENLQGNDTSQFNVGAINLLKHLLWESELQLSKAVVSFRNIVDHPISGSMDAADVCDESDLDLDSDSSTSSESEDEY